LEKKENLLNIQIQASSVSGANTNDMLDQRDLALKNLTEILGVTSFPDGDYTITVQIPGLGPIVSGPLSDHLKTARSAANEDGKPEGGVDVFTGLLGDNSVNHILKDGKLGGLLQMAG